MGLKQELVSPFQVSSDREWKEAYVVLRGTQLNIHRIKSPHLLSKNRTAGPGRLYRSYSLQHAEAGVASDFKKSHLIPKSPFAHLVPVSARPKLYESDPHLFEPVREHVLRLRVETEQFLLCASTQEEMLDWIEKLCAAIDISPPIEDRSEPRYRSLPRRSRRQRILEGARLGENLENLSSLEAGRRIIADQERIIRQLYPHLAGIANAEQAGATHESQNSTAATTDPETDDLDPDDVRFPSARRVTSQSSESDERPSSSATIDSADPKTRPPHRHTPSQALRYRRRCAPVLLACSPRVSDVVFNGEQRMRINVKEHVLVEYVSHPPRYETHKFSKQKKVLPIIEEAAPTNTVPAPVFPERPASPSRATSDSSFMSFGYDLSTTSSVYAGTNSGEESDDNIRSVPSSVPPSPTTATQAKANASRKLMTMVKRRNSDERPEDGLSGMTLGVGLLV